MTDLADLPGYQIRRLQQLAVAVFATRVAQAGFDLTPVQFGALTAIADTPGLDQATLANQIAIDRVTIGGVIDRLCQKGYVTRSINPEDRRARLLELTLTGKEILSRVTPVVIELQADILSSLLPAERGMFLKLLKKVTTDGPADIRQNRP